jgi:23S rRNA (guanosine2251-2'-O)-methyltransferase
MDNLIEGRNPILEALKAGRSISKILIVKNTERRGVTAEILRQANSAHIPVETTDRYTINRLSATTANQGIIAFTAPREYADIDDLINVSAKSGGNSKLVILDGIEDPHNLGAIIRTAEASGMHGIIIRERRAVGLTSAVEKASAGALEYMPVCRVANISQCIKYLKEKNIWIVGVDQSAAVNYTEIDYKPPTALVIGAEGKGISELIRKNCDFLVSIPMKGNISSLNASVAGAILMYEIVRQRSAH